MNTTPYITIYSTDDEIAAYAEHVRACSDEVMGYIKRSDMQSVDFAKALGILLSKSSTIGEVLSARHEFQKRQRSELRDISEQRRREAQLERRDEPSRG